MRLMPLELNSRRRWGGKVGEIWGRAFQRHGIACAKELSHENSWHSRGQVRRKSCRTRNSWVVVWTPSRGSHTSSLKYLTTAVAHYVFLLYQPTCSPPRVYMYTRIFPLPLLMPLCLPRLSSIPDDDGTSIPIQGGAMAPPPFCLHHELGLSMVKGSRVIRSNVHLSREL